MGLFISYYWPDLLMLFGIFLLSFLCWKRPTRKEIALVVIGEQCLTYLVYWYVENALALRVCYGFMYVCIYFVVANFRYSDKSICIISRAYLFIGIYHFLMVLEPVVIEIFWEDGHVIPYLNYAHQIFNITINILIILLVMFGGSFGSRRKRNLHDFSHCCFGFAAGLDNKPINQRK